MVSPSPTGRTRLLQQKAFWKVGEEFAPFSFFSPCSRSERPHETNRLSITIISSLDSPACENLRSDGREYAARAHAAVCRRLAGYNDYFRPPAYVVAIPLQLDIARSFSRTSTLLVHRSEGVACKTFRGIGTRKRYDNIPPFFSLRFPAPLFCFLFQTSHVFVTCSWVVRSCLCRPPCSGTHLVPFAYLSFRAFWPVVAIRQPVYIPALRILGTQPQSIVSGSCESRCTREFGTVACLCAS